jgi:antitoxin MazE
MTTQVSKWGNSLGLRIPKNLAQELQMADGDAVEIAVENGALIVRPEKKRYTIEELVADLTPDDRGEIDWGPPVGKEVW